jgi:hypothetical protein
MIQKISIINFKYKRTEFTDLLISVYKNKEMGRVNESNN